MIETVQIDTEKYQQLNCVISMHNLISMQNLKPRSISTASQASENKICHSKLLL